jgi:serine/threonine protein kinase
MDDTTVGAARIGQSVVDVEGRAYLLTGILGNGGQGTVYRTDQRGTLVKLFREGSYESGGSIMRIRRMPVSNLAVTAPMSVLERGEGYVMRLQSDMVGAGSLRIAGQRVHPKDFWIDSGGLMRRLALATRTALVVEHLHALGLIYGDLNRNNVMVSEEADFDVATLIDLDNLAYAGSPSDDPFYFPFFGAPELGPESPATFETDAFSLAVLIFELITSVQPFSSGGAVHAMATDSWEFVQAERCRVPSVIDRDDRSNDCPSYPILPPDRLISQPLLDLLIAALGPGRLDPRLRPSAAALRSACVDALADCVKCEQCSWTYPHSVETRCPDCSSVSPSVELGISLAGATTPSRRIRIGTLTKSFDFAMAFPSLLAHASMPGLFTVRLSAQRSSVRARPEHDGYVQIPPVVSDGDRFEVQGLGELTTVVRR